jgi:hypothetical protein
VAVCQLRVNIRASGVQTIELDDVVDTDDQIDPPAIASG